MCIFTHFFGSLEGEVSPSRELPHKIWRRACNKVRCFGYSPNHRILYARSQFCSAISRYPLKNNRIKSRKMVELYLYNTLTKAKQAFKPLNEGKVSIYVCGLTVYDLPHIGHARTFVVFDVFKRFLQHSGYDVTLVRNHTDIDDKIIRRAKEEGITPTALANRMIDELNADMEALAVQRADVEPRVSQHIEEIIAFIQKLINNDLAYTSDGDVYFRVAKLPSYGELSHRKLEDLLVGVRIDVNEAKENAADFALWKASKSDDELSWEAPWGKGRPGWHIECSAMSMKYLGENFDIHGGGRDLIFPHHENELAQSKGAHKDANFANYWMHVGMVEINGEKMSHSLKNFWTLRDILAQVHAESLRYFFLTAQYRNNINFSTEAIQEANQRVSSLYRTLDAANERIDGFKNKDSLKAEFDEALLKEYLAALNDDLNTPKALAVIAQLASQCNEILDAKGKWGQERVQSLFCLRNTLVEMGKYVGLFQSDTKLVLEELKRFAIKRLNIDVERVEALIVARSEARQNKDWARSDSIRDELTAMGVSVLDRAHGTEWLVN